jgi:hypothetical protein
VFRRLDVIMAAMIYGIAHTDDLAMDSIRLLRPGHLILQLSDLPSELSWAHIVGSGVANLLFSNSQPRLRI